MKRKFFEALEQCNDDTNLELLDVVEQLAFNEQDLIPVITQESSSKMILMFVWMNKEELLLILSSKRMTYWSRSREQLWIKGETSGHTQTLVSISFDCDGDAILCEVKRFDVACHADRSDCFYLKVDIDKSRVRVTGKYKN